MIISVTGSFGSGKSTVARMLAGMTNARIIDADRIAKNFLKSKKVIRKIEKTFITAMKNGMVSREKLASIVFNDKSELEKLERIIHPLVAKELRSKAKGGAVLDVPLLIEGGLHRMCDVVIVVKCNERARMQRLVKKGFTKKEIAARTKMQLPLHKKIKHADYVIDNSGTLEETRRKVKQIAEIVY